MVLYAIKSDFWTSKMTAGGHFLKTFTKKVARVMLTVFEPTAGRLQLNINSRLVNIYIQTGMLGTREYTLCSPFRANAHNSSSCVVLHDCSSQVNLKTRKQLCTCTCTCTCTCSGTFAG